MPGAVNVINTDIDSKSRYTIIISVFLLILGLRITALTTYPILSVDEGLWTLQAKDAALFGDINMNGLRQVFLSPLHFICMRFFFLFTAPTCLSIRLMSTLFGMTSLLTLWFILISKMDKKSAVLGLLLIGTSFTMVSINRRAFLESGVILFSLLAVYFSTRTGWRARLTMAISIATLLVYKSNAVYLLPCLLVPPEHEHLKRGMTTRFFSILGGILLAMIGFYLTYRFDPARFTGAYAFELTKGAGENPLFRFGRFGIYPGLTIRSIAGIFTGYTDLFIVSTVAIIAMFFKAVRTKRLAMCMFLWMIGAYSFLLTQGFQHTQYFAPIIIPAGILTLMLFKENRIQILSRRNTATIIILFALLNIARLGYGWFNASRINPPQQALEWMQNNYSSSTRFLACPEITAATVRRGYAFNRIFRPYTQETTPTLHDFIEANNIGLIILDNWESDYLTGDTSFMSDLNQYTKVTSGKGWTAYEVISLE